MSKRLKYSIGVLILVILMGILGFQIRKAVVKQQNLVQTMPAQTVQVQDVGTVKKDNYLELYGNIDAVDKVNVSSKVAGRVSKVAVDDGQAVAAGETLVVLEDQDYRNLVSTSQDTLTKAQLRLDDAQADYGRYQKLLAAGAIARNDVDKAKLGVEAAQADLNSAQTGVDNARQALDNTVITAPFAGVVASRIATTGMMISPGVPLLTLADVSSVYAVVDVKQDDLAQIQMGMPMQVMFTNADQHSFAGIVSMISPLADSAARVFEVRAKIDNKDGRLKPGMFVKTRITLGSPINVLAVPQYALSGVEGAYYVFVAEGDRAKQTPVQIGATMGDMIEIKSGLEPGNKVIVTNVNKLKDGDRIAVAGQ